MVLQVLPAQFILPIQLIIGHQQSIKMMLHIRVIGLLKGLMIIISTHNPLILMMV